jgi:hypothetical protein
MGSFRTLKVTAPAITITSQVLAADTGISATDGISRNGAVTLTGKVSGAVGTVVSIYDGSKLLGKAVLDGLGGWTFNGILPVGSHTLHAVAVDKSGLTATTPNQSPILVQTAAPLITISKQTLVSDTGISASDGITNNGAVVLSGTVSGAVGTKVQILDGAVVLGTAVLNGKGGWTFSTTLASGTHALKAVALDLAGNSATTATQPAIIVDQTIPKVSYTYETQVVGSNVVQLYGNVTGPAGTKVEIYSGTVNLGAATITGTTWQFATPSLADGNYSFTAVATTVAGNSATFGGVPSLTVGAVTGTLDASRFSTVWNQDFTINQIDRDIFPIVYGSPDQFSYGADGLTLTSYRSGGFGNVGILQANWTTNSAQGYGLYSITASHPANQGAGIAILLWPANNVWPGPELDMVEAWDDPTSQSAYFSVHFKSPLDGSDMVHSIRYSVDLTQMNTFSLDWARGSLTYYVNGHELFHLTGSEVPLDYADGGVNSAFGAQISDIGNAYEPSDQVSLTVANMSYSAPGAAPASIRVSNPGVIAQTAPEAGQMVIETITGINLPSKTVYVLVLDKNNEAYGGWEAVTLGSNGVGTYQANFHATGDYIKVTTDPSDQTINGTSSPLTLTTASNAGGLISEPVNHDHLWFERSGNDLVIDVLGTTQRTFIDNWYSTGMPWQRVSGSDGQVIDSEIDHLVQSMAIFSAANPGFNPMTTTHTSLTDVYFGIGIATASALAWHS